MTDATKPCAPELLPCPFCGGDGFFYENEVDFVPKWSVGCGDCEATIDVCQDGKFEAAQAWNARSCSAQTPSHDDIASVACILQRTFGADGVQSIGCAKRILAALATPAAPSVAMRSGVGMGVPHGSDYQARLDASVTPEEAAISVSREKQALADAQKYRNMTTAERCAAQGDGFINDYD